ncbi:MAG: HAMP domain-containing histidine kinase [Clostridiales bacterium]|jgi:signal transduction histidine kinase|nr:HAMP domain-containing histidine kinase [Clostridiales bacterium]
MTALAIACAALFLAALGYIFMLRRQQQRLFEKLGRLFDDAARGDAKTVPYDESVASALGDKIIRYISASGEHLAGAQGERDKIKALISDISHQTRTPIANILLYSGLLLEHGGLDAAAARMAGDIQAQAEKLRFLLEALVKMSRLETGVLAVEARAQRVKPLISAAVSEMYPAIAEKGIDLAVSADENLTADFDMKWTKEAVCNILDNAVKYSDAGGSVKISATAYEMFVRIDIADSGAGISPDERAAIFRRFYRSPRAREQEGIGVGLYLAREILALQGGYVKVASELGRGSVFSVFLARR